MQPDEHPYRKQPAKAFWKKTVEGKDPLQVTDWYAKKWDIGNARIATAGSCFAQHIGRRLRASGFRYLDAEPKPAFLSREHTVAYGFGLYSARYGNVYTTRQLLQLLQRATDEFVPAETPWQLGDGFVDPFRPTIEPHPLASADEVTACQKSHLTAVAQLFAKTDLFVFTLGLTEAWVSRQDGAVFPVCPGTQGGRFDPDRYAFVNFNAGAVRQDMEAFMSRAREINPKMRFLLTVSPVPLMATATSQQVVVATTYSKSVLRAVAGQLADKYRYVDYFPSYEIISSHVMRSRFYAEDMRGVEEAGVNHVMEQFFREHHPPEKPKADPAGLDKSKHQAEREREKLVCDEELLAAFGDPEAP